MKKAKIAFWLILIGFLGLLGYQNYDFFMSQHGLRINLLFVQYDTPQLQNAILFLIFFFTGLLISYFIMLFERFKSKKIIKTLNTALDMNQKQLDEMKKELDLLKNETPPIANPDVTTNPDEAKDSDVS
jgi:predicted membrane protein